MNETWSWRWVDWLHNMFFTFSDPAACSLPVWVCCELPPRCVEVLLVADICSESGKSTVDVCVLMCALVCVESVILSQVGLVWVVCCFKQNVRTQPLYTHKYLSENTCLIEFYGWSFLTYCTLTVWRGLCVCVCLCMCVFWIYWRVTDHNY
jgi:hypothetical protein